MSIWKYGKEVSIDVDVETVLDEMTYDELMEYMEDRFDGKQIDINKIHKINQDALMNYLENEWHRQTFSEFDFNKFFNKVGINASH